MIFIEIRKNYIFNLLNSPINYILANYFEKSIVIKYDRIRFLLNLLIALLIEKLSYQNAKKLIKIFFEIMWDIINNK